MELGVGARGALVVLVGVGARVIVGIGSSVGVGVKEDVWIRSGVGGGIGLG